MELEYGLIHWKTKGCTTVWIEDENVTDRSFSLEDVEASMTALEDRVVIRGPISGGWVDLEPSTNQTVKLRFILRRRGVQPEILSDLVSDLDGLIDDLIIEARERAYVAWG